jgi:hypothetical protein
MKFRIGEKKYYHDADIYDLIADRYNKTPDEIAEELKVKRIWTDGNTVNCTEMDGDDKELNTDDLVQYLCRLVDTQ